MLLKEISMYSFYEHFIMKKIMALGVDSLAEFKLNASIFIMELKCC